MTAPTDIDLDALDAQLAAMTPGPWHLGGGDGPAICHMFRGHLENQIGEMDTAADDAGIVALVNAAPALIARVRTAEARVAAFRAAVERIRETRAALADMSGPGLMRRAKDYEDAVDALLTSPEPHV
jgi:hypothetical protein